MEKLRIIDQQVHRLAAVISDVSFQIDEIFSSGTVLCREQCAVFQSFVGFLLRATEEWILMCKKDHRAKWLAMYEKESQSKCEMLAVGTELVGVVERGLQLLRQCEEKNPSFSPFIIFCSTGEFSEIIDDGKHYFQMMNNLIVRLGFQTIQHEVEEEFSGFQSKLISVYEKDKNAVMEILKQYPPWSIVVLIQSLRFPNIHRNGIFKNFFLQTLGKGLHPVTYNIAYTDLKIQKMLKSGSFGNVSKGLWCKTLPVAVKEFKYPDHFKDEYEVLTKLTPRNSFHLVQIFGHSEVEGKKLLVMELMDNDLESLIEERTKTNPEEPFSLEEQIDIMLQLARGMRSLHTDNVIHRDIKPSNIMVKHRKDGSLIVKLADFGTCKADFHTERTNTEKRGTKMYMAPEIAAEKTPMMEALMALERENSEKKAAEIMALERENSEKKAAEMSAESAVVKYSKKVDVYSFGIVWIEILTGSPSSSIIEKAKVVDSIDMLEEHIHMLIYSCLQSHPDERSSFKEICDQLWRLKKLILTENIKSDLYTNYFVPQIPTLTGKKAIYSNTDRIHSFPSSRLEGMDDLVDIELVALSIESSGKGELTAKARLLLHRFRELVTDHGKQLNLSFTIIEGSCPFFVPLSTKEGRSALIDSVLKLCKMYPIFNGLLFDITLRKEDGGNFILVLEQLRSTLPVGFMIGMIAPTQPTEIIWPSESERTIQLIDRIQLRSDFIPASPGAQVAHHICNLYSNSHQSSSMDRSVNFYISKGVHPSKIFLDCGHYERRFSKTDGIGKPAANSQEYILVCSMEKAVKFEWILNLDGIGKPPTTKRTSELRDTNKGGFVEEWDDEAKVPYAYNSKRKQISVYDNDHSIIEKAKYIKAKNLGGILIGRCDAGVNCKLVKALHDHLTHG